MWYPYIVGNSHIVFYDYNQKKWFNFKHKPVFESFQSDESMARGGFLVIGYRVSKSLFVFVRSLSLYVPKFQFYILFI